MIPYQVISILLALVAAVTQDHNSGHLGRRHLSDRRHGGSIEQNRVNERFRFSGSMRINKTTKVFASLHYLKTHLRYALPTLAPEINSTLTSSNVTGQLGGIVYLHCVVHNIGQKTVTWLRRSDYHVLTVGTVTYSSDDRFSAVHRDQFSPMYMTPLRQFGTVNSVNLPADDWILQIRGVQKNDEGQYECQVNTKSPTISAYIMLRVLSPYATIVEGVDDVSVNIGSDLSLTCMIHDCLEPPTHVFWYQGGRVLNYDFRALLSSVSAGRVHITNALRASAVIPRSKSKGTRFEDSTSSRQLLSQLTIHNVTKQHGGAYTCAPIDSSPATVHVSILHAEERVSRKYSTQLSSHGLSTYPPLSTLHTIGLVLVMRITTVFVTRVT